jgi:hypothetical protein
MYTDLQHRESLSSLFGYFENIALCDANEGNQVESPTTTNPDLDCKLHLLASALLFILLFLLLLFLFLFLLLLLFLLFCPFSLQFSISPLLVQQKSSF